MGSKRQIWLMDLSMDVLVSKNIVPLKDHISQKCSDSPKNQRLVI